MIAKTLLRGIREDRKKDFSKALSNFPLEKHNQLLLLELPFKIDIVSLMEMWCEQRLTEQKLQNTLFTDILEQWIETAKDKDNEKNRKNAIDQLFKKSVLVDLYGKGGKLTVTEFIRDNSYAAFKSRNSAISYRSIMTKKTYESTFRCFVSFIGKFLYGNQPKFKGGFLKRGIRSLELSEVASIFDLLELEALKCRSEIALRDLLFFRIMLYAGERVKIQDILKLKRKDIDFEKNIIKFKKKSLDCSSTFMKLFKSFLGSRRKFVFTKSLNVEREQDLIDKRFSKICKKIGILGDVIPKCIQRSFTYILKKECVIR